MSDAAAAGQSPKLDDLMLAMDVVDTLRHDQRVVERELSASLSDEALIERLREIYKGQGIEVSDQVLQEGVKALREKRFSYKPPAPGLARSLALMWIDRARYGAILAGVLAILAIIGAGHYFLVTQPQEEARAREQQELTVTLPKSLDDDFAEVMRESKVEQANKAAAQILSDGKAALARGDLPARPQGRRGHGGAAQRAARRLCAADRQPAAGRRAASGAGRPTIRRAATTI